MSLLKGQQRQELGQDKGSGAVQQCFTSNKILDRVDDFFTSTSVGKHTVFDKTAHEHDLEDIESER